MRNLLLNNIYLIFISIFIVGQRCFEVSLGSEANRKKGSDKVGLVSDTNKRRHFF